MTAGIGELIRAKTGLALDLQDITGNSDAQYVVASLLVQVAKSDGRISTEESVEMLGLLEKHFQIGGAQALELLTQAVEDLAGQPDLSELLEALNASMSLPDKEEIVVMLLKVIAVDGQKQAEEIEILSAVGDALNIPSETMHRAFERYFSEISTDQ